MYQITKMFVHFWLVFTVASLIYAFYMVYSVGWQDAAPNFFIPAIAFFWWMFRRAMMRRMERHLRERQEKENNQP